HVVDQGQRLATGAAAGTGGDGVERVDQKLGAGDQGAAAHRGPAVALLVDQADPVAVDGFGGAGRPAGGGGRRAPGGQCAGGEQGYGALPDSAQPPTTGGGEGGCGHQGLPVRMIGPAVCSRASPHRGGAACPSSADCEVDAHG